MAIFICSFLLTFSVTHSSNKGDDTKHSYEALTEVMNEVDFFKHGIRLTYQFSPLSWHFHSYKINQGESWDTLRHHWKYSVATHGISSTPTFNLNSVRIDNAENFTSDKWVEFLNQFKKIKSVTPNLSVDSFYRELGNYKGNK